MDPASSQPLFAEKARQLLVQDQVAVVFGCWTSAARKAVLPIFKEHNGLLFYPVQYEGEEIEKNVFYTGALPNQQAIPALEYLMSAKGGGIKRWILLGTDYVYPRTTNKILRAFLQSKKVGAADIMEEYVPFDHKDYQKQIQKIAAFVAAGEKTALISTINGYSNVHFYIALNKAGLTAEKLPVMAFSVGEKEVRVMDASMIKGHFAAWNYFQSLPGAENEAFLEQYKLWKQRKQMYKNEKLVTNDPMEATYIGINMWAKAVNMAQSTDTDKVIAAMAGQTFKAPSGHTVKMDATNHHLSKPVYIGQIQENGQFKIVWKSEGIVPPMPWSPFIEGNETKKNEPQAQ